MRLAALSVAALAAVTLLGSLASPAGSWASLAPAPAQPAPMGAPAQPVTYAPDTAGPWLLVVDRQGEPGESDVADYDLSLGDCLDAMNAQPREAHAACERDRG